MNISEHRDYDCNAFLVWASPCPFITWWISPFHCILMNFHRVCIFFFRELSFRDERSRAHWPSTTQVMPRWTTGLEEKQVWSYWTVMDWCSKVLVRIMGVALIRNRRKLANCFRIVFSMFFWLLQGVSCMWSGCDSAKLGMVECHHWRCICETTARWSPCLSVFILSPKASFRSTVGLVGDVLYLLIPTGCLINGG